MLEYVIDSLRAAGIAKIIVVVGYRAEDVKRTVGGSPDVAFALQAEQRGTGHAVMCAREHFANHDSAVVVVAGDSPLMQTTSIKKLLAEYERSRPACILGTAHKENPHGLGRIVRDAAGKFTGIVEEKDATPEQRQITEVNLSTYVFHGPDLLGALEGIRSDNAQGEYYVTDCPGVLLAEGKDVRALAVLEPCEVLSINSMEELGVVEDAMRTIREAKS
jgi:bifunctional UDP-N-acetylglucosamine pyrophosphorylase/glucosamine-1-phosphate N-acetyltransferase/UDP-N-acetylglucosamine pyrophosphorylase